MSTTRTAAIAAMMIGLLPAVAYAQQEEKPTRRTDEQKKEDAAIEKAYEQVVKGMKARTPPAKYDPWQTVRPAASEGGKK
ncbi:MAG TPA: hypothetical protein VIH98_01560 [Xanthobacteraceae bacterium]|jgi:hypothetical protein